MKGDLVTLRAPAKKRHTRIIFLGEFSQQIHSEGTRSSQRPKAKCIPKWTAGRAEMTD